MQLLRDEGLYESQEEAELRESVLGRLDSIVKVRLVFGWWVGWSLWLDSRSSTCRIVAALLAASRPPTSVRVHTYKPPSSRWRAYATRQAGVRTQLRRCCPFARLPFC